MKTLAKIFIALILITLIGFLSLYFFSPKTLLRLAFIDNPGLYELLEKKIEKIPRGTKINQEKVLEVETITLQSNNQITLTKSGKTTSGESSQIVAQISGKVTELNVKIGDRVNKNQVLARLGNSLQTDILKVQTSTAQKSENLAEESYEASKITSELTVKSAETGAELALIGYNNALITRAQALDSLEDQIDETDDAYDDLKDAQKELEKAVAEQQRQLASLPEFLSDILLQELTTQLAQLETQRVQTKKALKKLEDTYENQEILLDLSVKAAFEQCKNALNQIDAAKAGAIIQKVQAKSQLLQANSAKLIAEINESYTVITAPINGVITDITVDKNNSVNPGQPILTISGNGEVQVETFVNYDESKLLSVGQSAKIIENNNSSEAVITAIAPFPDKLTQKVKVILTLIENTISPEMNVKVEFKTTPKNIFIPINALFLEDNQTFVWVIADGKAQKKSITTGQIVGTNIEILSGLNSADKAIKSSNLFIEEGDIVTTS